MLDLTNAQPVSEFNRNLEEHVKRLKDTGKPQALTINGKVEVVVQSVAAYEKLLAVAESAETIAGIGRGLAEAARREGIPARQFLANLAAQNGTRFE